MSDKLDPNCVCHGNWRQIVGETEPLFDREYLDTNGDVHRLVGILWAADDFYYAMHNPLTRQMHLLTCVGRIEDMGFTLCETAP